MSLCINTDCDENDDSSRSEYLHILKYLLNEV